MLKARRYTVLGIATASVFKSGEDSSEEEENCEARDSVLGVSVLSVKGWVEDMENMEVDLRLDSGVDITLISEEFYMLLLRPSRIREGHKMSLAQLTDLGTAIEGYVVPKPKILFEGGDIKVEAVGVDPLMDRESLYTLASNLTVHVSKTNRAKEHRKMKAQRRRKRLQLGKNGKKLHCLMVKLDGDFSEDWEWKPVVPVSNTSTRPRIIRKAKHFDVPETMEDLELFSRRTEVLRSVLNARIKKDQESEKMEEEGERKRSTSGPERNSYHNGNPLGEQHAGLAHRVHAVEDDQWRDVFRHLVGEERAHKEVGLVTAGQDAWAEQVAFSIWSMALKLAVRWIVFLVHHLRICAKGCADGSGAGFLLREQLQVSGGGAVSQLRLFRKHYAFFAYSPAQS
ncbi:hypothetical protein B0H17DRAFT_1152834 [Mycena rosella]|uniref:Peptidase A2 domain-containing protein n=1 Tax=Mycena rosella TaxID=1033263 RepID=A0AAD7FEK5_MYCRO|nr:hypothetical protein B0H17DRAFT_1152834 [Mycena rosella]